MRGYLLRMRRHGSDCSAVEEYSERESENDSSYEQDSSIPPENLVPAGIPSENCNKDILMSSLELQRSQSSSLCLADSVCVTSTSSQRPIFNWNDTDMWKAMSRHPLFSKYMELQSELNKLFEEIRLDCKKAACEKAFASLLKETKETSTLNNPIVQSCPPVDTSAKKRGRPLKKKGRPRKDAITSISNGSTSPANKHVRKSREELFLARKPRWMCKVCDKQFSRSGWLERHESYCSALKFSKVNSLEQDENQESPNKSSSSAAQSNDTFSSKVLDHSTSATEGLSTSPVYKNSQTSPRASSWSKTVPVSPLQPKMENQSCAGDEEEQHAQNELSELPTGEAENIICGKCRNEFPSQSHFEKHLEDFSACKTYIPANIGTSIELPKFPNVAGKSQCKYCGKSFSKLKFLKRHRNICYTNPTRKIWQCEHCLKGFSRQNQFEHHQAHCFFVGNPITRQTHRCNKCSLLFTTSRKLLKHQAICCPDSNNHMVSLLKCFKCSVLFPSYKKQLKHRAICCPDSDTEAMVCRHCSKVFIMKDRMDAHRKKCPKPAGKKR